MDDPIVDFDTSGYVVAIGDSVLVIVPVKNKLALAIGPYQGKDHEGKMILNGFQYFIIGKAVKDFPITGFLFRLQSAYDLHEIDVYNKTIKSLLKILKPMKDKTIEPHLHKMEELLMMRDTVFKPGKQV